jgi:hypothetical protein
MHRLPHSPLVETLAAEQAAYNRQRVGFHAGLWFGLCLGALIGTLACALVAGGAL